MKLPKASRRYLVPLLGLAAALAGPALAQGGYFQSPTGNIRCLLTNVVPGVVCQTMNNARSVELDRYGVASTYQDSGAPLLTGGVLRYGRSISGYGVTCSSAFSGMRCSARGHGFTLSRSGVRFF